MRPIGLAMYGLRLPPDGGTGSLPVVVVLTPGRDAEGDDEAPVLD